ATFLSGFDVTLLPTFVGITAIETIPLVLAFGRRMASVGPRRLVPRINAASATLLLAEWLAIHRWPHFTSAIVYLHLGALGPIMVSGFWSTITERLDPRAAKRNMARIGVGATLGGIGGGLIAQATAAWLPRSSILVVVALLQLGSVGLLRVLGRQPSHAPNETAPSVWEGVRVVARSALLRNVAIVAVVGAMGAAALDYVFKAELVSTSRSGPLGALAIYYTITNVATAVVQLAFTSRLVAKLGVARNASMLPATLAGFGALAMAAPILAVVTIARGAEMIVRSSIFRAACELLLAPLPAKDKRPAKIMLDVGAERVGDLLGAQLVGLLLFTIPSPRTAILIVAVALGLVGLVISLTLPRAYTRALEQSLLEATAMAPTPVAAFTDAIATPYGVEPPSPAGAPTDGVVAAVADLRSGDRVRIERVLAHPLTRELAGHVLPLLAWTPVSRLAGQRLREIAPQVTGLLVDLLVDAESEFAVRRKVPEIVTHGEPMVATVGLWRALADPRFEVRFRAGKALASLRDRGHRLEISDEAIVDAIEREVRVDARIWHGHRLLDGYEGSESEMLVYRVLEQRSATALDHVFTLLGLVLPTEPVRLALQALSTDDPVLRGTALEYLESVLPSRIRDPLWPFLDFERAQRPSRRSPRDVAADLNMSHPSILANLRAQASERSGGTPSAAHRRSGETP
ncbi:MAG: hypothetical protein JWO36_4554, partial [Myxococcales bacterium]|nr:hypothetical protein [Myxococcales bacterium]